MTDTVESTAPAEQSAPKKRGGLNSMLIADLKAMANGMGIAGATSMKKAQLVEAIKAAQTQPAKSAATKGSARDSAASAPAKESAKSDRTAKADQSDKSGQSGKSDKSDESGQSDKSGQSSTEEKPSGSGRQRNRQRGQGNQQNQQDKQDKQGQNKQSDQSQQGKQDKQDGAGNKPKGDESGRSGGQSGNQRKQDQDKQDKNQDGDRAGGQQGQQSGQQSGDNRDRDNGGDDADGNRRNRRRRGRDRNRPGGRNEPDTDIREDDVLVPAAGILDVLDNYAFVRTSGYLAGADDVYLSLSLVRRYGLRRGDAIVGQVRQPREGERREKFNPMVRVDSVNGTDPEQAKERPEYDKLTPLYPNERLRMETDPNNTVGRVIDITAPIGKGQRGLVVSPSKAGKTTVLQSIATSIATNNPECHLMVVLVDERPEDVTEFERSVKGEVVSSTFDRPASDHTTVAELAIERAKRLVELGHDVVVLLDGVTRLGRAYNLSTQASGRALAGGVDASALYPIKRFFGAARNIENGGSLTILATVLIDSGSPMDEVIFEEVKGAGNMELWLNRDFAEQGVFPAVDAVKSGTRREELLMSQEELEIVWKLRRVLAALDGQQALELLLQRLKKSQTNVEFLTQVQRSTPKPDEV